jgi:DNA helicase HerA-like ATPase
MLSHDGSDRSTMPSSTALPAALGVVTEGSFSGGLTVRLFPDCPPELLRVGSFVVLEGEHHRYFGTITDIKLRTTDAALSADPPFGASRFTRRVLKGIQAYATVDVRPSLMLHESTSPVGRGPQPIQTIPDHFALLRLANPDDVALVFGQPDDQHFALGTPPSMNIPVPLDLQRLIQRSNGVFGQSGSGKSVLTRLLLFGIIKADLASVLLFDMHNEYATAPHDEPSIVGLVDLFGPSRIRLYTLDERLAQRAGSRTIQIGLNQIEPDDLVLLQEELSLPATFINTAELLYKQFKHDWIKTTLTMSDDDAAEFCKATGVHAASLDALRSRLQRLARRSYLLPELTSPSTLDDLLINLERGQHVILQFGRYNGFLDYMLVTNLITRRIYERYVERTLTLDGSSEGRRIVIVLEEAHKFLAPEAARQSIFGTIAREMRKYLVTLLVVDQRPSGIDPEVLSQLGTKIIGPLADQHDIDAVLTGTADRNQLRQFLTNLQPQQECLVIGHAVPMPILLRTRQYKREELLAELRASGKAPVDPQTARSLLYGE